MYVNQFYTDRPGATGTKHVYAGTSRTASKLLRQDTPGSNPNGKTPFEKDIYFYHPDHLGSSSYITDLNGKLYEALLYFPFGEGWIEENTNVQRTPYHFTAKELDEETGLYYFGARYYDPRTSVWQSADPVLEKYLPSARGAEAAKLPGIGGVFNSGNISLYSYSFNNPIRYFDPDGNSGADKTKPVSIVIRYRPLGHVPGVGTYHHAYVTATDPESGQTFVMRAGPGGEYQGSSQLSNVSAVSCPRVRRARLS